MKKAMYEQPNMQVLLFVAEDVIRTSDSSMTVTDNATFEGYTTENWS